MILHRLALPFAALAATLSVAHVAAEEAASAQQFLIQENIRAQANQNTQAASEQNAPAAEVQEQPKINKNAWKGLTVASAGPLTLTVPTTSPAAPAVNADNAQINALIEKHAAANGIPAAFVRAVVRIESNYNPRATGSQREVGLMQIKYETAKGIGFVGTREQLYDPDTNLQWGTKYLAMSWKLGGNTACGAVMKYQGGHGVTRMSPAANAYCAKVKAHMASAN